MSSTVHATALACSQKLNEVYDCRRTLMTIATIAASIKATNAQEMQAAGIARAHLTAADNADGVYVLSTVPQYSSTE